MITTFPNGIETVGIELEGFWNKSNLPPFQYDDLCSYCRDEVAGYDEDEQADHICSECMLNAFGLKEDGSVYRPSGLYDVITGEYASEVLEDWDEVVDAVTAHYPDHVSNRTGLHVHIGCRNKTLHNFSFSPTYWDLLMNRLTDLVEAKRVTGKTAEWLTRRMEDGRSDDRADVYCQPNVMNYGMSGGRYYHVNYASYQSHGTIEVRVLPMADHGADEALAMIEQVLLSTSQYWTQPVYWDTASSSVDVEEDVIVEEEENVTRREDDRAFEVTGDTGHWMSVGDYPEDDSVEVALVPLRGWSVETEMEAYQEEFERMIDRNRG